MKGIRRYLPKNGTVIYGRKRKGDSDRGSGGAPYFHGSDISELNFKI
jgi:hypothetical protein